MKYVDTLASYLPSLIVQHLTTHDTTAHPPGRQRWVQTGVTALAFRSHVVGGLDVTSYFTVCMFADVSGFTKLSEAMAKHGPEGAEYLAKHVSEGELRLLCLSQLAAAAWFVVCWRHAFRARHS